MSSKIPITDTFNEVKKFIELLVLSFYNKYHFDYDLCIAEGFYGFLQAYDTYNPNKGTAFTTWLHLKVNKRLKCLLYQRIKESQRFVSLTEAHDTGKEETEKFNPEEWLKTLSLDAQEVVKLVLEKPIDIVWFLNKYKARYGGGQWRPALRAFLRECEWSESRIQQAFSEIRGSFR